MKKTYEAAVELFAYLCKLYGLNPTADGVIISHREGMPEVLRQITETRNTYGTVLEWDIP